MIESMSWAWWCIYINQPNLDILILQNLALTRGWGLQSSQDPLFSWRTFFIFQEKIETAITQFEYDLTADK